MAGGDLDIAQVNASIERCRDECVAKHVRVRPGHLDAGHAGKTVQAPGSRMLVHPGAAAVEQAGPRIRDPTARSTARPTAGGSGTRTALLPLPHTRSTR